MAKQDSVPLKWAYPVSFFLAAFATAFFPHIRLIPFAPLLALIIMEKKLLHALWIAALCGLFLDLIQCQDRFGLYALSHTLATLILYKQRHLIFFHKRFSLPIFTTLFAFTISCIHYLGIAITGKPLFTSWGWLALDTALSSLLDGITAALFYTLPIEFYHRLALKKSEQTE